MAMPIYTYCRLLGLLQASLTADHPFIQRAGSTYKKLQPLQQDTSYFKQLPTKNGIRYKTTDDLDLIRVVQKALSFVKTFRTVLFTGLVLGLTAGLFLYFRSPKQFSTRLIVRPWFLNQTGLLSNQEEIEIVENWQQMLSAREKLQLASALNCELETINNLKSISAEEILRTYVANNPNGFLINVTVTDTAILDDLQKGIIYGLDNSPYTKEKIDIRRKRDIELIAQVKTEIASLESTRHLVDSMITVRNAGSVNLMVDIARINSESVELNEKMLGYQEDLKFISGVQVLGNFNKGKLTRPGLAKFSLLGLASGAFVSYLLCIFLYLFRQIKEEEAGKLLPSQL
jgi:hypothetical protein